MLVEGKLVFQSCHSAILLIASSDGHSGLYLSDNLEKGTSSPCPTFGNEPLSDIGDKFDIIGVEIWYIGV